MHGRNPELQFTGEAGSHYHRSWAVRTPEPNAAYPQRSIMLMSGGLRSLAQTNGE